MNIQPLLYLFLNILSLQCAFASSSEEKSEEADADASDSKEDDKSSEVAGRTVKMQPEIENGWASCVRNAALAYIRARECARNCGEWQYIYPLSMVKFAFEDETEKEYPSITTMQFIELQQLRLAAWSAFGTQEVSKKEWKGMTIDVEGSIWGLHFYKINKRCK